MLRWLLRSSGEYFQYAPCGPRRRLACAGQAVGSLAPALQHPARAATAAAAALAGAPAVAVGKARQGLPARLRRGDAQGRPPLWLWGRMPALLAATGLPLLLPSAHVYDLARMAATDAVLAVGYCVVLGLCGQFSVAHAALFGVGAYATAILTATRDVGSGPALLAAVGAGLVAGTLVGLPALRLGGDQLAVVTLGLGAVAQVVMFNATALTGGFVGISDIPAPSLFGVELASSRNAYLAAAAALVLSVAAVERLRRSPLGLAMLAVREDEVAARAAGVRVGAVKVAAFGISGAIAGLAGWLYAGALVSVTPPAFDITLSVLVAVMVLIGGRGRVYGAVLGAGLVATLQNQLSSHSSIEEGATGAAILLVVLWRAGALHDGLRALRRLRR